MATIAQSMPVPKKRSEGLAIMLQALNRTKVPLLYITSYNVLIALLLAVLYPTMTQGSLAGFMSSYLSNNVIGGIIGSSHITNFSSYAAFIGIYFYSAFGGILFGGILAYVGGVALPVNIENGMLDLALARPISRTRYYLETWLGIILCGVVLAVLTVAVLWIMSLFVKNASMDWGWLWITQIVQFALLFLAGNLGMLMGSWLNSSRAAAGAAVGVLVLGYLLNTAGGISDKLSWLLKISPFYYAPSIDPLVLHQLTWWYPWVLVVAGVVCGAAGLLIFNRRDLPTV